MDRLKKILTDNKDVFILFALSRLMVAVVLLVTRKSYADVLQLFDAEHYRLIASEGYCTDGITVFFPVIPLIIRYLGDAGLVIINHIAFLAALIILKKLFLKIKGESKVSGMLAVVAVSPLALFTSLEYTEALFFLFTAAAFYLFVNKANPLLMGLLLGLSVATRNTGSLLFFAVFIGMVMRIIIDKEYKKGIKDIFLAYVPATLISLIYPAFLQLRFGNWKVFMDAQYSYWIRIPSNLIKTTWISIKVLFTNIYQFDGDPSTIVLFKINEALSLGLMLLVIVLIVREISLMKSKKSINVSSVVAIVYSALFIIALGMTIRDPNIDCPTDSFYRYYASLFPLYLGIGRLGEKPVRISLYITSMITLITASMFCLGVFFF